MKTPTKREARRALAAIDLPRSREGRRDEGEGARSDLITSLRIAPTITVNPEDGHVQLQLQRIASPVGPRTSTRRSSRSSSFRRSSRAEHKKRVVLYFDEFQEITDIDPKLPTLMRAVFQEQPEVAHVYAGSKRDMMQRLFTDENEPFYKSAKVMEIGTISPKPVQGVRQGALRLDRPRNLGRGVDELLDTTRGHPYATQELAYALWEEVPEGFTATVDGPRGVRSARSSARRTRSSRCCGRRLARAAPATPGARGRAGPRAVGGLPRPFRNTSRQLNAHEPPRQTSGTPSQMGVREPPNGTPSAQRDAGDVDSPYGDFHSDPNHDVRRTAVSPAMKVTVAVWRGSERSACSTPCPDCNVRRSRGDRGADACVDSRATGWR